MTPVNRIGHRSGRSRYMTTRRALLKQAALGMGALAARSPSASLAQNVGPKKLTKICLEEHFIMPEFLHYWAETFQNISPQVAKLAPAALLDLGDRRIATMDEYGIDFQVLSIAGPGVQRERDRAVAVKRAK